jgi:ABC-2 type transport system permease protein
MTAIARALDAEWIKLRSVRSTYWTVLVAAAITIAVSILDTRNVLRNWDQNPRSLQGDFDPLSASLTGLYVTQVGFGVLGVLAIGSEYATGQIRTTLTTVPQRLRVLTAKTAAVAAAAIAVGLLTVAAAFAVGQTILAQRHLDVTLSDPGVLRGLLAAVAYLGLFALLGLGVTAITRHTAGAVGVLFSVLYIIPLAIEALPKPWDEKVHPYLPSELGQQMYGLQPAELSPGVATITSAAYAAVALGLAGLLMARRDA